MTKTALVFMTASLTLSGTSPFEGPEWAAAQEVTSPRKAFYQTETEACTLVASSEGPGAFMRLDIGRKNPDQDCAFTQAETVALFTEILKSQEAGDNEGSYTSLMLGSLAHYAWMQRYLMETARRDDNWSQETGRPVSGHENSYVNSILNRPAIIGVFNKAGAQLGYRFSGASCEKVFISEKGLPYDAHCWIEMTPE